MLSLFTFLLLAKCEAINEQKINSITPIITEKLIQDLKKCADEMKWLLCNLYFSKCIHSTITNEWKYIPVCQESCYSFITTKHCLPVSNFVFKGWQEIGIIRPEFLEKNEMINCSLYSLSGSNECQYSIVGKLVLLLLNAFYDLSSLDIKTYFNFVINT